MTGFYRDACCNTGREDVGSHTVCAVMTAASQAWNLATVGACAPLVGGRHLKQTTRRESSCAPRMSVHWLTAHSLILSGSQSTWL